jgi:hypothetical protein
MKVYYWAGLEQIAMASGCRGTILTSWSKCTNFKQTHQFILQSWEAFYEVILKSYIEQTQKHDLLLEVGRIVNEYIEDNTSPIRLISVTNGTSSGFIHDIQQFTEDQGDKTWVFWGNLSFKAVLHMFAFSYLYEELTGICVLPVLRACFLCSQQKIISYHLADILTYPSSVLEFLSSGGFTVFITEKAVALNEPHEMCIYRDMKSAVTYPTKQYLQKSLRFSTTILN